MRHLSLSLLLIAVVSLSGNACVERTPAPAPASTPSSPTDGGTVPTGAPATQPARTTPCPPPKSDAICTKEYKPVTCDGCTYANGCLAGAAGFQAAQCAPRAAGEGEKKCPEPAPGIICTMEYAPVLCDGCRYPNACVAGAAGFKKEQCKEAPAE